MHHSSYLKGELFVDLYVPERTPSAAKISVLEVGSKSYHAQDTFAGLFESDRFEYTGLDIEDGNNVDIVPQNPFCWNEIEDDTFDLCVSGQTFEHNPYFWSTFADISRILKPGGLAFIIAPASGKVHRYPVDCWRFYPDSWSVLSSMTGVELLESYVEQEDTAVRVSGGVWRDSACIIQKPALNGQSLVDFNGRLHEMLSFFRNHHVPFDTQPPKAGKWVNAYENQVLNGAKASSTARLKKSIAGNWGLMFDDKTKRVA